MSAPSHEVETERLIELLQEVRVRWPDASVIPNALDNLAIFHDGAYVGYVDLGIKTVEGIEEVLS